MNKSCRINRHETVLRSVHDANALASLCGLKALMAVQGTLALCPDDGVALRF